MKLPMNACNEDMSRNTAERPLRSTDFQMPDLCNCSARVLTCISLDSPTSAASAPASVHLQERATGTCAPQETRTINATHAPVAGSNAPWTPAMLTVALGTRIPPT